MSQFIISSPDFNDGDEIPKKFGYHFENIPPKISFTNFPKQTKSFALIMDDPDAMTAVGKIWVHWLFCNRKIDQNSDISLEISLGKTDFDEIGYGGPAPPDKSHTYFFKGFALDVEKLDLEPGYSKNDLEKAMRGHILDKAILTGTFSP